jgi:hypothetical protein
MSAIYCGGSDLDLLDQLAFIGVHRIEAENHVVLVRMSSRIAQCAKRVHGAKSLLAAPFQPTIDALRFIDNDNRPCCPNQIDRLFSAGLFAVLVKIVYVLLVDGTDRYHHDLNVRTGREISHLSELGGIVEEIIKWLASIEALEMLFGDLKRLVDAFFDRHRRHHYDELGEAEAPVQLEYHAQVYVGLACAGFHLHGEVARRQCLSWPKAVADLHRVEVLEQLVIEQRQAVAQSKVILGEAHAQLRVVRVARHGEFRPANLLSPEQIADRLDCLKLIVEAGLELQFHGAISTGCAQLRCRFAQEWLRDWSWPRRR